MTFQRRLLLAAGGGWLFDAMDLLLLGSVVAAAVKEWGLSKPVVGGIITANLIGMFLGAALSGVVADRFGRKAVFTWTLLAYSLLSGLSAFAWSAGSLAIIRFFAGLGLGGELPVASTLVSEFSPTENRGRTVVLLESFWAYGTVIAALIGAVIVPNFGWRVAFLIGMLPALYVFVIRRAIPESPRYLLAQGRGAEAREVARIAGIGYEAPARAPRVSLQTLFAAPFLKRTAMLWALWIALVFSYYGIFTWLPTLLLAKGFTLQQALWLNLAIAIFQIPGYYAAAALVDRWGRKPTLVTFLACAAAGSFFFASATLSPIPSATAVIAWGAVIAFFNLGAWGVTYTYTPEQYPTAIRASGAGLAAGAGRFVGAFAPALVGVMLVRFGSPYSVFIVFACVMLAGALVVLALGEETRGKSLEELSDTRIAA
ncbi:MAG TPA: MFS transporter [Candidatus Elarobacter sp.]|jgi:putative MFS transporter|nr:MFS transporter [Candidatus Elarobacter sp.]